MDNLTEITITATFLSKSAFAGKINNQKIKFAYDDHCKGKIVEMSFVSGILEQPDWAINIPHDELVRLLEFLISAKT